AMAPKRGLDWSTQALQALKGHKVKIKGWMLFDFEHIGESENTAPKRRDNWQATAGRSIRAAVPVTTRLPLPTLGVQPASANLHRISTCFPEAGSSRTRRWQDRWSMPARTTTYDHPYPTIDAAPLAGCALIDRSVVCTRWM